MLQYTTINTMHNKSVHYVLHMHSYPVFSLYIITFIFMFSILAIYIETVYTVSACGIENQFLTNATMSNKRISGSYNTCHQVCLLIYSYSDRFNKIWKIYSLQETLFKPADQKNIAPNIALDSEKNKRYPCG